MNRALRHDALLLWRESAAALAGWGDRLLVIAGLAVIAAGARHAAATAAMPMIGGAALVIAAWIGFGVGRIVERRLAFHRDDYLFAEDILSRGGAWRYRSGALAGIAVAMLGVGAGIDPRAIGPALAGLALSVLAGCACETRSVRRGGAGTNFGNGRLLPVAGALAAVALATMRWWWPGAPAWVVVVPILCVAVIMAPDDAEAVRFEAMVGHPVRATIRRVMPAVAWCAGLALIASIVAGTAAAAIGLTAGAAVLWLAALRVLAWRRVGRRSGELIVLAIVAMSGVAGAMALVLAPVALALATGWLWRRSQAATWLIA